MRDTQSRRPARLLWLGGATLLASGLALPLAIGAVAQSRFADMEEWATAASRAWHRRDFRRPALWGETLPGSAFDAYARATTLAIALRTTDEQLVHAARLRPAAVNPEDLSSLRERWAPAVAALRDGAHRADARPPADPDAGFAVRMQDLLAARLVAHVMVLEARELLHARRGRAAVEMLLDATAAGLDFLLSPMVTDWNTGLGVVWTATSDAWRDDDLRGLDPQALAFLADGLRRTDAAMPAAPPLSEGTILWQAAGFLGAGRTADHDWRGTWRHGLSVRWAEADYVLTMTAIADDLRDHADLPWSRRDALIHQHEERLQAASNPWSGWSGLDHERVRRVQLTRLRLLRLAVDVHLGRPLAPLADPLGDGALTVSERDGEVRIESSGRAGISRIERVVRKR